MVQKSPEGNKGFPLETSFTPVLLCFRYYQLATEMTSVLRKHLMANTIALARNTGAIIFTISQESCPLSIKPCVTSWSRWNYTSCIHYVRSIESWKVLHLVNFWRHHNTPLFKLGAGLFSNNSNCVRRCINWIKQHKHTEIDAIYKKQNLYGRCWYYKIENTTLNIFQPLDYIIRECFVLWHKESSCGSNSIGLAETRPTKKLDLFHFFIIPYHLEKSV